MGQLDRETLSATHADTPGLSAEARDRGGSRGPGLRAALCGKDYASQVQLLSPGGAHDVDVQGVAAAGVSGSGGRVPHFEAVQRSFGAHDISGVQAHVGGRAAEAASAIGAEAYATGDAVAFAGAPSLHTAAHEAAHVVQQRQGVQLAGGVGRAGDAYERHADQVADAVVRGESAEALLGGTPGGGSRGPAGVQRQAGRRRGPEPYETDTPPDLEACTPDLQPVCVPSRALGTSLSACDEHTESLEDFADRTVTLAAELAQTRSATRAAVHRANEDAAHQTSLLKIFDLLLTAATGLNTVLTAGKVLIKLGAAALDKPVLKGATAIAKGVHAGAQLPAGGPSQAVTQAINSELETLSKYLKEIAWDVLKLRVQGVQHELAVSKDHVVTIREILAHATSPAVHAIGADALSQAGAKTSAIVARLRAMKSLAAASVSTPEHAQRRLLPGTRTRSFIDGLTAAVGDPTTAVGLVQVDCVTTTVYWDVRGHYEARRGTRSVPMLAVAHPETANALAPFMPKPITPIAGVGRAFELEPVHVELARAFVSEGALPAREHRRTDAYLIIGPGGPETVSAAIWDDPVRRSQWLAPRQGAWKVQDDRIDKIGARR